MVTSGVIPGLVLQIWYTYYTCKDSKETQTQNPQTRTMKMTKFSTGNLRCELCAHAAGVFHSRGNLVIASRSEKLKTKYESAQKKTNTKFFILGNIRCGLRSRGNPVSLKTPLFLENHVLGPG